MIIRQMRFSGVNKLAVHEEKTTYIHVQSVIITIGFL